MNVGEVAGVGVCTGAQATAKLGQAGRRVIWRIRLLVGCLL